MKHLEYWVVKTRTTWNTFWKESEMVKFCRQLQSVGVGFEVYQKICAWSCNRFTEGEL